MPHRFESENEMQELIQRLLKILEIAPYNTSISPLLQTVTSTSTHSRGLSALPSPTTRHKLARENATLNLQFDP